MKKLFAILLCALLLVPTAIGASAANVSIVTTGDPKLVYHAAYGTPVVDGVMDEVYASSDAMVSAYSNKADSTSYAEYRMVFNETSMFIFCHVTDVTRFSGTSFLTTVDCVDMVIDLVPDFTPGVTDKDVGFSKVAAGAQFRVNPALSAADNIVENGKKATWGTVYTYNIDNNLLRLAVAYDNSTDGSYTFELSFNFTAEYAATLKANLANGVNTAMGFGLLVNESKEAGKRYAMTVSNNCGGTTLSKSTANLGRVELDASGYGTTAPETTVEPETSVAPETTVEPETSVAPETTVEPETSVAPETTVEPETTTPPLYSPDTGDNRVGAILLAVCAVVSLCAFAVVIFSRSKKKV